MLVISDGISLKYLEANEKYKLQEFVNKKIFKVSDTPLTYRQVNTLDTDKLLSNERVDKKGWRKFSYKELVYTLIVSELKKFGFKHEQLKQLWQAFFSEPTKEPKGSGGIDINRSIGETAIGCVFGEVEIILCVDSNGSVVFYDPINYSLFYQASKSHIQIVLNNIINGLRLKAGKEEIPIKWSVQQSILDGYKHGLSTKEADLLKIIRNDEYSTIRIKKKDGEVTLVSAEMVNNGNSETMARDLIAILNKKDFQDISIVKRDGKIVNYKVEETIKI